MHAHTATPPQSAVAPRVATRVATRVDTGRGTRVEIPSHGLLRVVAWHDPVVDERGHPTHGDYVEWFWLPVLGPTATWLARRLAAHVIYEPDGALVDLADLAASLGVVWQPSHDGPFTRALARCIMFGACAPVTDTPSTVAVRLSMPQLPARHVTRLPTVLREMHNEWLNEAGAPTSPS